MQEHEAQAKATTVRIIEDLKAQVQELKLDKLRLEGTINDLRVKIQVEKDIKREIMDDYVRLRQQLNRSTGNIDREMIGM